MQKKSQITIFIILGLVLIFLFLLFYRIFSFKKENENAMINFEIDKNLFENYLEQCLKIATNKSVERYGLNYIEEQIEYFAEKKLLECTENFKIFKDKGINVNYNFLNIDFIFEKTGNFVTLESNLYTDIVLEAQGKRANIENKKTESIYENFDPMSGFAPIYRGVFYKYEETNEPRPLHIFIVKIDLYDPTLKFYVTPRIAPDVMVTSDFLASNKLQLAINGGGFDIGNTNEVNGFAAYNGVPYSSPDLIPDVTFFITENNEIYMMPNMPNGYKYAITGFNHIIQNGKISDRFYIGNPNHKPGYDQLNPRTSVGLDENEKWLNIIVIDGRNPGISEGVSALELGEIHLKYGSTNMLNMDGGGSTTLVIEEKGSPKVLNNPSDGQERPVANHFGVWAEDLSKYIK
ncbi:MAG: phosphodiester glycosidase family protein [Candidatus Woesearchaeota archaeon]